MNFLHTYHPSPSLLSLGPVSVHWYGLLLAAGIIAGYAVTRRLFRAARLTPEFLDQLFVPLIVGGFAGARLYHVANEFFYYVARPLEIFTVWNGGLAIHGAIIGGLAALWWLLQRRQMVGAIHELPLRGVMRILFLADLLAPSLALGQAIGRWGNYFNQELYGMPTPLPWGIPIDLANRVPGFEGNLYFHPTFLYESVWLVVVFVSLFSVVIYWLRKQTLIPGRVFCFYLILTSIGRFFVEFLRIDSMPHILGVRLQQLVSVILIVIGIAGMIWLKRQSKTVYRAVSSL